MVGRVCGVWEEWWLLLVAQGLRGVCVIAQDQQDRCCRGRAPDVSDGTAHAQPEVSVACFVRVVEGGGLGVF